MPPAERDERIRQLQRRLYSADAVTDASRDAVIEELRALEAERAAELGQSGLPAVGVTSSSASTDGGASAALPATAVSSPAPSTPRARRRSGILFAAACAVVALIVGVAIGVTSSRPISDAVSGALGATATPEPSAAAVAFARPQGQADVPDIPLGDRFVAGSFRQLLEAGLDTLYLARNVDDEICLIVVIQTQDFAATCSPEADIDASGLQLRWQSMTPYRDLPGQPNVSDFAFTWHPDGTSSMEASD
ncbi:MULTISPECIES: hypothetical protein [unclassified Leifsonia]|uniref:hypothetical protein n=1 Tax=unclassified Leifsonia TaxID=2663824 RepID=UPI000700A940|nr:MULTISPECIES: hypothetical protein [unclassified Leifsonia]KQX05089.1 hypothetical protein ASC59_12765 [Leifsonia sp. Root1293]KRA08721.1 hypothetical protein ASD61_12765 [Leifsonia sp. Root60]